MTEHQLTDRGVLIRADFGGRASIKERTDHLRPCQHEQTIVDEVVRSVECGTCGAPLDAFQVLLEYARKERHWRHWQAEVSRCHNELAKLKEEERKVKARTKSHARKDALEAVRLEQLHTERMRLDIVQIARDVGAAAKRIEQLAHRGPRKDPKA